MFVYSFFRVEMLQDVKMFKILFSYVTIFDVIYYHDGVLCNFSVDRVPKLSIKYVSVQYSEQKMTITEYRLLDIVKII